MSINRFLQAQKYDYSTALAEIKSGRKQSHWIWYIFPQMKGLGRSSTAEYYGIDGRREAEEYMADSTLRARLVEISRELLKINSTAEEILGFPDNLKVKSCMTLFAMVTPDEAVFQQVLDKFYGGELDEYTVALLKG